MGYQKSKSTSRTEPWGPARPYLLNLLGEAGLAAGAAGSSGGRPSWQQNTALNNLWNEVSRGNTFAPQYASVAGSVLDSAGPNGLVAQGYRDLNTRLGSIANGSFLTPTTNPYLEGLLNSAAETAQNRVNSQFAGAGRSGGGYFTQNLAKGISEAQLPFLFNQYNTERQAQADAAKTLFEAGRGTATTNVALGQSGVALGNAATAAREYGPLRQLEVANTQRNLPLENLSAVSNLLLPLAGLGGTTSQTTYAKKPGTSTSQWIGAGLGGLGVLSSLLSLSDRRLKRNAHRIGSLPNGLPVWSFEYVFAPGVVHTGFMADEVRRVLPDAAITLPSGYLAVDYGKVLAHAAFG